MKRLILLPLILVLAGCGQRATPTYSPLAMQPSTPPSSTWQTLPRPPSGPAPFLDAGTQSIAGDGFTLALGQNNDVAIFMFDVIPGPARTLSISSNDVALGEVELRDDQTLAQIQVFTNMLYFAKFGNFDLYRQRRATGQLHLHFREAFPDRLEIK